MNKKETWKFLRNISTITLITALIITLGIILTKDSAFIIIIFWPLIIVLAFMLILSTITLLISLSKIKNLKEVK